MKPGRVALLIVGILVGLIAFGLLAGGGALIWAHVTVRDADGYYTTVAERLESPSYALVSRPLDLTIDRTAWVPKSIATFRLRADGGEDLFIGIAPTEDVRAYLRRSPHTVLTDLSTDPFAAEYRQLDGSEPPSNPRQEDFWVATARGGSLTWDVRGGEWSVVVMNADATEGVQADLSVGVKTGLLLPIGIGMLVVGLLVALGAFALIRAGARRDQPRHLAPGETPTRPDVERSPAP